MGKLVLACALGMLSLPGGRLVANAAPIPLVSPNGGVFLSNVIVVALTSSAPVIRFTLDGSEPGTNSPLFSTPLLITNSTLLQARAFAANGEAGELVAETYTLLETNLLDFTSNLPLVIINTFGRSIPPGTNTPASVRFINVGTNSRAAIHGVADFEGRAAFKARGYTSLRYPKKSFGFETRSPSGESLDVSILGLPKDSDWILYAPYPDKTLMRDVLAYELSNKLGRYASRTRFVEVFVNDGTGKLDRTNYAGVYVLEEKIKRGPHRVSIQKLSPKDNSEPAITGGYIFKKDHLEEAGGEAPGEVPGRSSPFSSQFGLPSGPGGFPADRVAFTPLSVDPAIANAIHVATNFITLTVTNSSGSNSVLVVVSNVPVVTIVGTNAIVVTNLVAVTNTMVATNLVVTTNGVISTNIAITMTPVLVTNALVASHSVAATNALATTNAVDSLTAVVTTTATISTTTTYRTNFVPATNIVSTTNITFATNLLAHTNSVINTNVAIVAVPVYSTNSVVGTNTYVFGPRPPSPHVERLLASGEGFVSSRSNAFFFSEPKAKNITAEQRAWLTNHLNKFEHVLHGPEFRDPAHGYSSYIDVDSFVDHHLLVEATKNIDGFRFSTFFTKERGGKIKMEPIWDWNLSWGNAKGKQGALHDRWYWPQLDDRQYSWFRRLFEDPDFAQRYVDRWAAWRTNLYTPAALGSRIDEMAALLKEGSQRNFERWPILGSTVGPEAFAGKTWEEDLLYFKTWITNRIVWMDGQFVAPPAASIPAGLISSTNSLVLTVPAGNIYFTTDGSDPRASGGVPSPTAKLFETPFSISGSLTIRARAQRESRWSPPVAFRYLVQPLVTNAGG